MKGIVAVLLAGLLMPAVAFAQEWQAYTYPDPGFAIQFPSEPAVQTSRIKSATGAQLPMTRYAVRQDHIVYTLNVVNYSSTNSDGLSAVSEAERSLGASGKVTAATGVRVKGAFGRKLTVSGSDGSRSAIAIFFVNQHLYTLVGQALPPNAAEKSGDAARFQESLQFLNEDGGFRRFFGGAGAGVASGAGMASGAPVASGTPVAGGASVASGASGGHSRDTNTAQADAACAGKSVGDTVQLQTPAGPVFATCTLVARPNIPPSGPSHSQ